MAHADWSTALLPRSRLDGGTGEWLPAYRPPLGMSRLFGPPTSGFDGALEVTVRYLTPHPSGQSTEYQDNLFMLSLSRGGPDIWMSNIDAAKAGIKDNDWIESSNRNGVVVARAVVTHRMPEGTVYVPREGSTDRCSEGREQREARRHPQLTDTTSDEAIALHWWLRKLSYGFNYYGPTGNQRDEVTVIRRRSQEVEY